MRLNELPHNQVAEKHLNITERLGRAGGGGQMCTSHCFTLCDLRKKKKNNQRKHNQFEMWLILRKVGEPDLTWTLRVSTDWKREKEINKKWKKQGTKGFAMSSYSRTVTGKQLRGKDWSSAAKPCLPGSSYLHLKKKKKRNSNKVPLHTVIMDSCFKYRETAKTFFNEGIYLSF